MRYSEIAALPGTPEEAKNAILDLVAVYLANNKTEIPLDVVLKTLHRQNFDVDRRLIIDIIKTTPAIKRISGDTIYLQGENPEDALGKDEAEKSKDKVKDMAKKTIKKAAGE